MRPDRATDAAEDGRDCLMSMGGRPGVALNVLDVLRIKTKPGKKSEVVRFLQWDMEVAKEKEKGTLRFDFYDDPSAPDGLWLYEAYKDVDATEREQAATDRSEEP